MKIEMRRLSEIKPYDNNPRVNDAAVDAVARSIQEFGWRVPIVCDEQMVIIAGLTRYKAAIMLGLTEVPVHVAVGLTPAQAKAFRLADNKSAELSTWDYDLLPIELADLQGLNYDLDLLGFDQEELAKLLNLGAKDGLCDPDEVPEPPDEAVTKPGELIILGGHRLLNGDSTKAGDMDRLLDGQPVHLVNTDPPYGVQVEPRSNNAIAAGLSSFEGTSRPKADVNGDSAKSQPTTRKLRAKDRPLANDFLSEQDFNRMLDAWFGNLSRVLLPGHGFFIWDGYSNLGNYSPFLKQHGLYFRQGIVWDKEHPVMGRKDFMGCFELAFYGWKEGAAHCFFGPNNAMDLWHIKKVNPQSSSGQRRRHPEPGPLRCLAGQGDGRWRLTHGVCGPANYAGC